MESKITVYKDQFRIKSTTLAEEAMMDHRALITLIGTYESNLNELGSLPFGGCKNPKGRDTRFCYLNESQTLFISSMVRNSDKKIILTKALINEFDKVKGFLYKIKEAFKSFDFDNINVRYVYAAKDQHGNIKIGISNNPERRVKELSLGNACNLELIYVKKAELPKYQSEALIHKKAKKHEIKNEWFTHEAIESLAL